MNVVQSSLIDMNSYYIDMKIKGTGDAYLHKPDRIINHAVLAGQEMVRHIEWRPNNWWVQQVRILAGTYTEHQV